MGMKENDCLLFEITEDANKYLSILKYSKYSCILGILKIKSK